MTRLHLIKGGKSKTRHGGGSKGPAPAKAGPKRKRANPFNALLWAATSRMVYKSRANSAEEIADRMTKLSKRVTGVRKTFTREMAVYVEHDGRRRKHFYGWMLMHVEKGAAGVNRGYVPVLTDVDEHEDDIYLIDDDDIECVEAGLKSSIGTATSMIVNDAEGLTMYIGLLEALGRKAEADRIRDFAAECRTFARRAAEIRKEVDAL